jgi:hypothetical protein
MVSISMDNSRVTDIIITILFGLFIGYILCRVMFVSPTIYHGPVADIIKENVYFDQDSGKCYRFTPVIHICPPSMKPKKTA